MILTVQPARSSAGRSGNNGEMNHERGEGYKRLYFKKDSDIILIGY